MATEMVRSESVVNFKTPLQVSGLREMLRMADLWIIRWMANLSKGFVKRSNPFYFVSGSATAIALLLY